MKTYRIYLIVNLKNGKFYVGQHSGVSLHKYLEKQIRQALRGDRGKLFLYQALRDHGPENFIIKELFVCKNAEDLNWEEKHWIQELNAQDPNLGYNITSGGAGRRAPHTEETKKDIGEKVARSTRGKKQSEEHKRKRGLSRASAWERWRQERGREITQAGLRARELKALSIS